MSLSIDISRLIQPYPIVLAKNLIPECGQKDCLQKIRGIISRHQGDVVGCKKVQTLGSLDLG